MVALAPYLTDHCRLSYDRCWCCTHTHTHTRQRTGIVGVGSVVPRALLYTHTHRDRHTDRQTLCLSLSLPLSLSLSFSLSLFLSLSLSHTHMYMPANRDSGRKALSVVPRALLPELPSPSPSRAANTNRGGSTPRDGLTSSCDDGLTRSHIEGFLFGDALPSSCDDALDEIPPEIEISSAPETLVSPPGATGGAYTPPPLPLPTRARSRDTPSPAEFKTPRAPPDHELVCSSGGGGGGMQVRAPQTPPDHERMYPSPAPEVKALYAARTTPPPPAPILASASQKSSLCV